MRGGLLWLSAVLCNHVDYFSRHQKYHVLQDIALDLTAKHDPAVIQKVADYFVENEQYDKAIDLLAIGKRVCILGLCKFQW